jgi:AraC-like DNA-binding protein
MLTLSFEELQKLLTQNFKVYEEEQMSLQMYHTTYASTIQSPVCEGEAVSTTIREGITLLKIQLTFKQDTQTEIKSLQPQIGFAYCLAGTISATRNNSGYLPPDNNVINLPAYHGYMYVAPTSQGWQYFKANICYEAIYIHFSYPAFIQLVGDQLDEMPTEFKLPMNDYRRYFFKQARLAPAVVALCESLFNNPFSGKSREFYREAKVIELIAYQLDELVKPPEEIDSTGTILTQKEEMLIERSHQLLIANLVNPPSLMELAREIGMSDYRLKHGFKQKYGQTPYRFIAEKRMLTARELLAKGNMNVSEVANAIGFNSLGSFSNSFYEKFGIRPSEVK